MISSFIIKPLHRSIHWKDLRATYLRRFCDKRSITSNHIVLRNHSLHLIWYPQVPNIRRSRTARKKVINKPHVSWDICLFKKVKSAYKIPANSPQNRMNRYFFPQRAVVPVGNFPSSSFFISLIE